MVRSRSSSLKASLRGQSRQLEFLKTCNLHESDHPFDRYRINDKTYTQEVKTSPFSLLQQQPGEFAITSIAHQQKMCKASVTDLHLHIHSLPSAQVGDGKRIYQDIHEGVYAYSGLFVVIGVYLTRPVRRPSRDCVYARWRASFHLHVSAVRA